MVITDVFVVCPSQGPKSIMYTGKTQLQHISFKLRPLSKCSLASVDKDAYVCVAVRYQLECSSSFRSGRDWSSSQTAYPTAVYKVPADLQVFHAVKILTLNVSDPLFVDSVLSHRCLPVFYMWTQARISVLVLISTKAFFHKAISVPSRLKRGLGSGNGCGDSELGYVSQQYSFQQNVTCWLSPSSSPLPPSPLCPLQAGAKPFSSCF